MPDLDNHIAGYKRPPKATQFKPGQSGNKAGRPKGSRNKPNPPRDLVLKGYGSAGIHLESPEQMQQLLKMLDYEINKTSVLLTKAENSLKRMRRMSALLSG